tara:strand:+ start:118 stop:930 length:813 start_codon:yes stop_codon:yes gene_type:complete
MKNFISFLILLILSTGCYVPKQTFFSASDIVYEQTPSYLIQKSIKALNAANSVSRSIDKKDKIIIASIENHQTVDSALVVGIEDEIIKEFVLSGYTVLERDLHTLQWMNNELNFQDTPPLSYQDSSNIEIFKTPLQLSSADKIISYRIIECGIIYKEDPVNLLMYKREARTILEIRVVNAKTSQVIDAVTLDGISKDEILKQNISDVNKFNYQYYKPLLPITYYPEESEVVLKKQEQKKQVEKPKKRGMAGIFGMAAVVVGWFISIISLN